MPQPRAHQSVVIKTSVQLASSRLSCSSKPTVTVLRRNSSMLKLAISRLNTGLALKQFRVNSLSLEHLNRQIEQCPRGLLVQSPFVYKQHRSTSKHGFLLLKNSGHPVHMPYSSKRDVRMKETISNKVSLPPDKFDYQRLLRCNSLRLYPNRFSQL